MARTPNPSSPTSRRKRAPGRPAGGRSEEPSAQRAQLLDAAIACFVRKGIAATSLRDIAQEAQVTPSLLHYYFGDKAQLQTALAEERLLPLIAQLRAPLEQAGDDIAALIAGFVAGVGRIAAAHPWLPALWVREVLCEGGALREFLFERIGPAIPLMMARRFAAAQARGELNEDLDPRLLMVSLVGLTLFPIAGAPIWRRLFADDPTTASLDFDTLRRHTLALLDRGLALDPLPAPRP
jgi:AcrR family transcriptional regulator